MPEIMENIIGADKSEIRDVETILSQMIMKIQKDLMDEAGVVPFDVSGDPTQEIDWVRENSKKVRAAYNEIIDHIDEHQETYEDALKMARNGDDHVLKEAMMKEIKAILSRE